MDKPGTCYLSNIGYRIECRRTPCTKEGEGDTSVAIYNGESSRAGYTRSKLHINKYLSLRRDNIKSSFMWQHCQDTHGGQRGEEPRTVGHSPITTPNYAHSLI